jgi:hypothetical protein
MGERDLTALIKAELSKDQVYPGLFVEMLFDGGAFRAWSGMRDFPLNGNVFVAVGHFGKLDSIQESAGDVKAAGVALSLSGIPSELLSLVLDEDCQGRPVNIWLAFFDSNWQLVNDAIKLNGYAMDFPTIDEGGETATITINAESILADLERPRISRYNHESQIALFPDDKGLEFVTAIQNVEITWKAAT